MPPNCLDLKLAEWSSKRVASVAASRHCQTLATCLRKREHNCRAAACRATIHSVSRRDDGGRWCAAAQHSSRMHRSGHQRKYLNTGSGFLWRFNELADTPYSWPGHQAIQTHPVFISLIIAREEVDIEELNPNIIGVLWCNKVFLISTFNVEMSSLDCIWLLAVLVEFWTHWVRARHHTCQEKYFR